MTFVVDSNGVAVMDSGRQVIEKWVAALESGDYEQTTGTLQRIEPGGDDMPIGFCCLGVLCDLAVKEGVIKALPGSYNGKVGFQEEGHLEYSELPSAVRDWAGLESDNPFVQYELTESEIDFLVEDGSYDSVDDAPGMASDTLAELNDSKGRTFRDIAQIIRDNYLS